MTVTGDGVINIFIMLGEADDGFFPVDWGGADKHWTYFLVFLKLGDSCTTDNEMFWLNWLNN